jgi:outer membrane protein TolC
MFMMNVTKRLFTLISLALLFVSGMVHGQNKQTQNFSLSQAIEYALQNSPVVQNSRIDLDIAKKKIWETTAIGLPQANVKLSATYMLTVPGLYSQFVMPEVIAQYSKMNPKPADSANFVNDAYNKAIDDMRLSGTVDFTVSQLIFSGSYIVGLQTSKIYKGLSELSITKSENDLRESIINSYALVLIARENLLVLDSTYNNTVLLANEIKKMQEQGLVEETDADQMDITLSNIKNQRDMVTRQIDVALRLLKFQMGYDMDAAITLTDGLNMFTANEVNLEQLNDFNPETNVNYQLAQTQEKLMKMNLKLKQSDFLPTISAYYQHEELLKKNAISFTPPDLIGLSVSLPIFTSGQRLSTVSQAKMTYQKAQNDTKQASDGLKLEFFQDRANYLSAHDKYITAKKNLDLSKKIYDRTLVKYRQGVTTSLDLTQNQNQYLQNQATYYNSIVDLTSSRAKFEKLLSQKK